MSYITRSPDGKDMRTADFFYIASDATYGPSNGPITCLRVRRDVLHEFHDEPCIIENISQFVFTRGKQVRRRKSLMNDGSV